VTLIGTQKEGRHKSSQLYRSNTDPHSHVISRETAKWIGSSGTLSSLQALCSKLTLLFLRSLPYIFLVSHLSPFLKISLFLYHTLSSLVTGKLNEWNVSCCDKQRESVLVVQQQTAVHSEDHTDFKQCEGVGAERGQWVNWKLTVPLYRIQSSQSRN